MRRLYGDGDTPDLCIDLALDGAAELYPRLLQLLLQWQNMFLRASADVR
jgi:hypothetical protein